MLNVQSFSSKISNLKHSKKELNILNILKKDFKQNFEKISCFVKNVLSGSEIGNSLLV
jgi:hypothetical protein